MDVLFEHRRWPQVSKLKPRWDVHLAGSFAGKLQPWIAGLSGSAVSPRLCGG